MQTAIFVEIAADFADPASLIGARFTIDDRDDCGRIADFGAGNASHFRGCITLPDAP